MIHFLGSETCVSSFISRGGVEPFVPHAFLSSIANSCFRLKLACFSLELLLSYLGYKQVRSWIVSCETSASKPEFWSVVFL